MIFCKHCEKQVMVGNKFDMDVAMWRHMREQHPKIFNQEKDKELEDIWRDNFRADNQESEYEGGESIC